MKKHEIEQLRTAINAILDADKKAEEEFVKTAGKGWIRGEEHCVSISEVASQMQITRTVAKRKLDKAYQLGLLAKQNLGHIIKYTYPGLVESCAFSDKFAVLQKGEKR